MGLLDDAIREHLDLKRRRGADPGEVERAEREALGPVRRNREAAATAESDVEPVPGGLAYDQADDEGWRYEDDHAHDEGAEMPETPEEDGEDELPPGPPSRFARGEGAGAETAEYDVEGALAADEEPSDDMLEETPEFLQDTPDHDRLWFEQRPPRDFDFDG